MWGGGGIFVLIAPTLDYDFVLNTRSSDRELGLEDIQSTMHRRV